VGGAARRLLARQYEGDSRERRLVQTESDHLGHTILVVEESSIALRARCPHRQRAPSYRRERDRGARVDVR